MIYLNVAVIMETTTIPPQFIVSIIYRTGQNKRVKNKQKVDSSTNDVRGRAKLCGLSES